VFASVDAARSSERPALDQFDVPGSGLGGGFTATWSPAEPLTIVAGIDLRLLDGATNEDAGFVAGSYLRRRHAGGEQLLTGAFVRAAYEPSDATRFDASARLDFWSLDAGRRLEISPATGLPLRTDIFPDRDGLEPGFALAVRQRLCDSFKLSGSAGTSFRLPTINELYRPFRVRNDITEANALLDPERFFSLETVVAWTPDDRFSLEVDLFHHWINDAIANVLITDPAEAAAIAGFVPAGGTVSQKRNIDEARVWGAETKARWQPDEQIELSLTWLYTHTEFTESTRQPLLEGRPFPQAPNHRLVAGIELRPNDRLQFFADLEYGSPQYDDAFGTRKLGSWWTTRIGASWQATDDLTVHARIENVFDQEVTTGLSSNGLRSIGMPRSFWVGVERQW
jgi:outer membrane receptor protein involved in Fe transport